MSPEFEARVAKFSKLSAARKYQLKSEARKFIHYNPGCADHSNFWMGLSTRQILETHYLLQQEAAS